ncbi:MAG: hypothetical protein IJJ45_06225 [Clostridia bacterium]|nr:hypothetical protein [Clostridia bacterium]
MDPISILMFVFSGALLLYAALLAATKDYGLIPRGHMAKVKDRKAYAANVARMVALVAMAPLLCGLIAPFSLPLALLALFAGTALAIWIGLKAWRS